MMIRRVTAETLGYMTEISKARRQDPEAEVSAAAGALQKELNRVRRELLKLLTDPNRKDAGVLANIVTYSQRLKDKLENYYRSCA